MKIINLQIKGMHCNSCKILLQDVLQETPGVKKADVFYEKGSARITFDEIKTNEKEIKKLIKNKGYEAT